MDWVIFMSVAAIAAYFMAACWSIEEEIESQERRI